MKRIILASKSPRRIELLKSIINDFKIQPANIEEQKFMHYPPALAVMKIAEEKGKKVAKVNKGSLVIAADTVVVFGGEVLGQPKDENDAFEMLKTLNGNKHCVFTGISVISGDKIITDFVKSTVVFKENSESKLWEYIKTGEPMDKAGAYAIQGKGRELIESFIGCFHNIIGLPILRVSKILHKYFNFELKNPFNCTCE